MKLKRLADLDVTITSDVAKNQKIINDILEVYAYHILVDVNGNIPYSEALQGRENPSPAYDDAATIYTDLINRLTADASCTRQHFCEVMVMRISCIMGISIPGFFLLIHCSFVWQ